MGEIKSASEIAAGAIEDLREKRAAARAAGNAYRHIAEWCEAEANAEFAEAVKLSSVSVGKPVPRELTECNARRYVYRRIGDMLRKAAR